MKKFSMILTVCFVVVSSFSALAQLKVASNGYVGVNNTSPAYRLDIKSGETKSSYLSNLPLHINHWGYDPRICSADRVIFYKIDGSGYINIECQVCTEFSDSTAKENIVPITNRGVEAIKKLRGVSFNWKNDKSKRLQSGFLAQEVEKVIPEAVFTNDTSKIKSIAYSFIIPYLAEAIKEQQSIIEELKNKISAIEANCCSGNLKSSTISTASIKLSETQASLDQNIPNPFSMETRIGFFIPEVSGTSVLYIYNMNGTQLQQYNVNGKGKQSVTINGNSFEPGMYLYALVIDGKEVDTKRMILTK